MNLKEPSLNDNTLFLTEVLAKRLQQFSKIQDSTKRFERIIELGKRLEAFPEELKQEENKVTGCASLVYIVGEFREGLVYYKGWSNSHLVQGLLALLIEGLSGQSPETILKVDPRFIEQMGIAQTLTASRANGFMNTFTKMRAIAEAAKQK